MDKNISNMPLNPQVVVAGYDRNALKTRIVHIGFGAFHRAHQGLVTHDMLEMTGSDWGICEVSLFSGHPLIQQLREQDHLYTVVEKGAEFDTVKLIGAVKESLHPVLDSPQAVIDKMSETQVAIVSLTITEKGYCADLSTGRLDLDHPQIQADLRTPSTPVSAIGYVVEALRVRREKNIQPFTVLSCDNIQGNGQVTRQVILDFAHHLDAELGAWIDEHVTFPCTMVDRIVPAATNASLTELAELVGMADPCGITCEPFLQWVIEDDFVNGRPNWNVAGATFVDNVEPYEKMKLRMLNGSHSFLAYLGYLGGYQYIFETMADEYFRTATLELMLNEQAPTLEKLHNIDLETYAQSLINRFSNINIKHETWQIATDGSQKLPQRWCESVRYHLNHGTDYRWLALGIAGWMVYIKEVDERSEPIVVRDPMLEQFREIHRNETQPQNIVKALLSIENIFGRDLRKDDDFIEAICTAYQQIVRLGARKAISMRL